MPISFDSRSHGRIVFGFYNIETDNLLLNDLFFFCSDFCDSVRKIREPGARTIMHGHVFLNQDDIGDFAGAMRGVRFTGYMGELYRVWPFPSKPEDFRQKLYGARNREKVQVMLSRHATKVDILLSRLENHYVQIGDYLFDDIQFMALLHYIRRGGMPCWEGHEKGERPAYVGEMLVDYGIQS